MPQMLLYDVSLPLRFDITGPFILQMIALRQ